MFYREKTVRERKKERKRKQLRRFTRILSQCELIAKSFRELIAKSDNGNKNDNIH